MTSTTSTFLVVCWIQSLVSFSLATLAKFGANDHGSLVTITFSRVVLYHCEGCTSSRAHKLSIYSTTPRADSEEAANLMLYLHTCHSPHVPLWLETVTQRTWSCSGRWVAVVRFAQRAGRSSLAVTTGEVHSGAQAASLLTPYRRVKSQPHRLDTVSDSAGSLVPAARSQQQFPQRLHLRFLLRHLSYFWRLHRL